MRYSRENCRTFIRTAFAALTLAFVATPHAWGQTFSTTGSLNFARAGHQATLLLDGRVLVSGGYDNAGTGIPQAEIFNPATGVWSVAPSNQQTRLEHTSTLLQDGRVLVVGGAPGYFSCTSSTSAETLAPGDPAWVLTGVLPAPVGSGLVAVRLKDAL